MAVSKTAVLVLLCMLSVASYASPPLTCPDVRKAFGPCINSGNGPGGSPTATCCNGIINGIVHKATSTPNLQAACRCLNFLAGNVPGVNVAKILHQCGVRLPFRISHSTNCDKVT